jgi:hypothetical protein
MFLKDIASRREAIHALPSMHQALQEKVMNAPLDGIVKIKRGDREYSATYRVIGGVVSVSPSVGESADLNIDNYDRPADEIARMLLESRIDEHLQGPARR